MSNSTTEFLKEKSNRSENSNHCPDTLIRGAKRAGVIAAKTAISVPIGLG